MAEGVVSQLQTGVEPHVESFDSLVHLAPVVVELFLIDKTHGRNFILGEGGEKFTGHFGDGCGGHGIRGGGGQIVDGDGDLAVGWNVRAGCRVSCRDGESQHQAQKCQNRLHGERLFVRDFCKARHGEY